MYWLSTVALINAILTSREPEGVGVMGRHAQSRRPSWLPARGSSRQRFLSRSVPAAAEQEILAAQGEGQNPFCSTEWHTGSPSKYIAAG